MTEVAKEASLVRFAFLHCLFSVFYPHLTYCVYLSRTADPRHFWGCLSTFTVPSEEEVERKRR